MRVGEDYKGKKEGLASEGVREWGKREGMREEEDGWGG